MSYPNLNGESQMPNVIKNDRVIDDAWKVLTLAENETPERVRLPAGPLLVPASVWQARRRELVTREYEHGWPLGVWLAANEAPETVADDLDDFTVVAVHIPKFNDGRGYSIARLLRERYGYRGELRAIGDVLRDQLFYLARCGFDAFALRADQDPAEALPSLHDFDDAYQAAADQPQPLFRRRAANPPQPFGSARTA
jgi:uncharacterized protein (DUF934 family)